MGARADANWELEREREMLRRERERFERERQLWQRESASPFSGSVNTQVTTNLSTIAEMLPDETNDFENWRQVVVLCNTYQLDDNAAKVLIILRLKGKALR